MTEAEAVPLDLLDRKTIRTRARNVAIAALIVAAAMGGIVSLFAGPTGFGVTAAIVGIPLLLLAFAESRKTIELRGGELVARAMGTRVVEVKNAERFDLFVTDLRGARTVNLLVGGPPKGKAISVSLALYAGTGGRELGIYALRRLADTLAASADTRALVLSQLIVAQLRAEARGDAAPDRPLYRLASVAPPGRMAQRLHPDAVARFVAALG
ncbi:hypothetical protein AB0L88_00990 [Saccharopolyspora shandongensis]|uniref:Uncharacterized protein n=1 Tax=Saccharopolyspora shandongensis TaxID=418495 RepID=A0A1H3RCC5_9PSEU|nr:hypothetical protein [Saccharopolyspora shandongensis]SDZ22609.1 hypothetical protein SAMN05216215_10535 [Saccharopolyspora shandongensis]